MDIKTAVEKLDQEWDERNGFFGKLRGGIFDNVGLERVRNILEKVDVPENQLNSRFVALTWFIPTFMSWQRERVREKTEDISEFDHASQVMVELLYRVLGVP